MFGLVLPTQVVVSNKQEPDSQVLVGWSTRYCTQQRLKSCRTGSSGTHSAIAGQGEKVPHPPCARPLQEDKTISGTLSRPGRTCGGSTTHRGCEALGCGGSSSLYDLPYLWVGDIVADREIEVSNRAPVAERSGHKTSWLRRCKLYSAVVSLVDDSVDKWICFAMSAGLSAKSVSSNDPPQQT